MNTDNNYQNKQEDYQQDSNPYSYLSNFKNTERNTFKREFVNNLRKYKAQIESKSTKNEEGELSQRIPGKQVIIKKQVSNLNNFSDLSNGINYRANQPQNSYMSRNDYGRSGNNQGLDLYNHSQGFSYNNILNNNRTNSISLEKQNLEYRRNIQSNSRSKSSSTFSRSYTNSSRSSNYSSHHRNSERSNSNPKSSHRSHSDRPIKRKTHTSSSYQRTGSNQYSSYPKRQRLPIFNIVFVHAIFREIHRSYISWPDAMDSALTCMQSEQDCGEQLLNLPIS